MSYRASNARWDFALQHPLGFRDFIMSRKALSFSQLLKPLQRQQMLVRNSPDLCVRMADYVYSYLV